MTKIAFWNGPYKGEGSGFRDQGSGTMKEGMRKPA